MSAAALDRLLAILVAALLVTGLVSLRAGSPPTAPLFVLHGMLAGSLLAAVALKLRRSAPRAAAARRWGALALAMLLALFTIAALVGGFAWVLSGRILSIGPWTVMTLHAWAALCLVPVLVRTCSLAAGACCDCASPPRQPPTGVASTGEQPWG